MKTISPDHYQFLVNIGLSLHKSAEEQCQVLPPDRIPVARFGQGLDGLNVAVGNLMLGDASQARIWFRKSAEYFLEANRSDHSVIAERRALECATLCGNREFRIQAAEQILPRKGRVKPMEHSYLMFLKYTILGNEIAAARYADETVWLSRATMKKRRGYGTLVDLCKAFSGCQPAEITSALEALLREHKMKASHGLNKVPDGIICFPAATLLILAHAQGLPIHVTSPFIPVALLE